MEPKLVDLMEEVYESAMSSAAFLGLLVVVACTVAGLWVTHIVGGYVHALRIDLYERVIAVSKNPATPAPYSYTLPLLIDRADCFSAGWGAPRSLVRTLLRMLGLMKPVEPSAEFQRIPGIDAIVIRFALSSLVANPIALALSIPLVLIIIIVGFARHMTPKQVFAKEASRELRAC